MTTVMKAANGKITFTDNFDVDLERLICAFVCTLVELRVRMIHDTDEIISHERLFEPANKYGLCDVTNAKFERQGFKYDDAVALTGIPIDQYGEKHYKIWCIEGDSLTPEVWGELVCATLDAPFRSIFMETIGGNYTDGDQ